MLKQAEIDVQSTSNRKLPNFYEKVTDFLLESYRISKWWQNHAFTETCRICHIWRILTCWTIWLFIRIRCMFMHLCRPFIHIAYLEKLIRLYGYANRAFVICQTSYMILSNCSMIENIPPKGVSFSDLICIFAMSIVEFSCLFCNTKISEFFDMAKPWAARLCRLPKQVTGSAALSLSKHYNYE